MGCKQANMEVLKDQSDWWANTVRMKIWKKNILNFYLLKKIWSKEFQLDPSKMFPEIDISDKYVS